MTKQHLVVVRAGDNSLHPHWLAGDGDRTWDLVVSYFGDDPDIFKVDDVVRTVKLLIIDELGYVPLSQTGAELLFEICSQRHERGSTIVTSNLPFEEWTSVFQSQRLTGALLDHLTHHVHILELNGENYRLKQSKARRRREAQLADLAAAAADPETGEITSAS